MLMGGGFDSSLSSTDCWGIWIGEPFNFNIVASLCEADDLFDL